MTESPISATVAKLFGRLAHDMKNPLAVVLSNLQFLEEQLADVELREAATESLAAAERLGRMIADVAELESLREGTHQLLPAATALRDVAQQVERAVRPQVGSQKLTVSATAATVLIDGKLLTRSLTNLAEHATKHTPPRCPVGLVLSCDDHLEVRASDSGLPFSADATPSFLARALPVAGPPSEGCRSDQGLGLHFAGTAARAMGAELRIHPREDDAPGVVFSLDFPDVKPLDD